MPKVYRLVILNWHIELQIIALDLHVEEGVFKVPGGWQGRQEGLVL